MEISITGVEVKDVPATVGLQLIIHFDNDTCLVRYFEDSNFGKQAFNFIKENFLNIK